MHELFESRVCVYQDECLCLGHKSASSAPSDCNINLRRRCLYQIYERGPIHLLKSKRILSRVFHPALHYRELVDFELVAEVHFHLEERPPALLFRRYIHDLAERDLQVIGTFVKVTL